VRAQAVKESNWRKDFVGDNGQSFGIMQIKSTMHQVTYPATARSTAFNLDYALAWRRACYEGYATWMGNGTSYAAGFEWGCVGAYYSGGWYDAGAQQYIQAVQANLQNRVWLQPTFSMASQRPGDGD